MKEIKEMPNDFCPKYKPELKTFPWHADTKIVNTQIAISCENEPICKMWVARINHEEDN